MFLNQKCRFRISAHFPQLLVGHFSEKCYKRNLNYQHSNSATIWYTYAWRVISRKGQESFLTAFRPGSNTDHSLPYSAEVKNTWSYTSTPPQLTSLLCGDQLSVATIVFFVKIKYNKYKNQRCFWNRSRPSNFTSFVINYLQPTLFFDSLKSKPGRNKIK